MNILDLIIGFIPAQFFYLFPNGLLRKYYTPRKLVDVIQIYGRPYHEGATVDVPSGVCAIDIQILNPAPFEIELISSHLVAQVFGVQLSLYGANRVTIPPYGVVSYLIATNFAELVQRCQFTSCERFAYGGKIEFQCRTCTFTKTLGNETDWRVTFLVRSKRE